MRTEYFLSRALLNHEIFDATTSDEYYHRFRGIAQSGSAPALGAGCRGFESLYPDQI